MTFLAPVIFWSDVMDQEVTGAKKVIKVKNWFFRARQPHEEIFEIGSCCGPVFMALSSTFNQLFPNNVTVYQKHFWLKSLHMVRTISGLMPYEIRHKYRDSNLYVT